MNIFNVRIIDPSNLGDQVCGPTRYFDDLRHVGIVDIRNLTDHAGLLIFGGGGMLHGPLLDIIEGVTISPIKDSSKLAAWGLGTNVHGRMLPGYPKFLDKFDLVGLRDFSNPWQYVPCSSCLNPAFPDVPTKPVCEMVIYEHKDYPIPIASTPKMSNGLDQSMFRAVLAFLSMGETVLTNTYHGAYWAMLLGRKVVLYRPFSNRFFQFKHQPPSISDEADWREASNDSPVVDGYLDECQKINEDFHAEVMLLNDIGPSILPA